MKKQSLKHLRLKKQSIANFGDQIKGGSHATQPCGDTMRSIDNDCFVRESENQSCYGEGATCQAC